MKTINKDIDIFFTFDSAEKAFIKEKVSCDFLYAPGEKSWFIDRSKTALKEWPSKYEFLTGK